MLAEVNVWVDIIAIVLTAIGLGFWVFQIVGNTLTGRFRKKFVEKQWPHHDAVVPLSPKLMHGTHVTAMIALGVSGLYTRFPVFSGGRDIMKTIHFVAMYTVVVIFVMRVYYAFTLDGREFTMTLKDVINTPKVLMYYTFIGKSYPHLAKYNVMQKMTYGILFPVFMVVMMFTGFGLMWPKTVFGFLAGPLGGVAAAAAWARIVHFTSAMILIMFTLIHICLSFIEDYPALLTFFGLAKQEVHEEHGHEQAIPETAVR